MNGSQTKEAPLAWSQTGDAIELPASAAMWRVRRLTGNGKGGAPELVYGGDGLPLVVDITMGTGEFAEAVDRRPGKYRLEALDELRRSVQGVPSAYVVVGGQAARAEVPDGAAGEVALKTLADVFMRQSAHVNSLIDACTKLVTAVDAAGVSRRQPPPIVVGPDPARQNGGLEDHDSDDSSDEDADDYEDEVDEELSPAWLQHVTHFCATVPPDNLRALGQAAPDLLANGIRRVMREGFVDGILGGAPGSESEGAS